ncbi:MAG TPA: carboxy-S-adenosyl-L-methionine synthase CmoA, partial [Xanthomonadales bacterium]|nr:carboxy-S-adenosyl-L-methionine synthase CmoA [Xanthomonadales bacterium]
KIYYGLLYHITVRTSFIECARSHPQLPSPHHPDKAMSERDQLFEQLPQGMNDFVFDERVVRVFPDMINRSVPGYGLILPMLGVLARRCVQPGSRVYDLGCSLGAVSRVVRDAVSVPDVRIIAVDNSADMLNRFEQELQQQPQQQPQQQRRPQIELVLGDISTTPIEDASLSVLNFTLQFIRRELRQDLLARIAAGTRPGGALVLSEKIRFCDAQEQALQNDWHHDFKRAQGYSDLEIARKRDALEQVLIPDTEEEHLARLQAAGWSKAVRWFQCFNFVSYLAIR